MQEAVVISVMKSGLQLKIKYHLKESNVKKSNLITLYNKAYVGYHLY